MSGISESCKEDNVLKEAFKNKPKENYKIVLADVSKKNDYSYVPIAIEYFHAEDDIAALSYLEEFKKNAAKLADSQHSYFWMHANTVIGSNGKFYDSLAEDLNAYESKMSLWKKAKLWIDVNIASRMCDAVCWLKDLAYWIKTKHNRHEAWEMFSAIIEILIHNLPILIKHHTGIPTKYCIRARKQLHAEDAQFDSEADFDRNPRSTDEEMKLASKLYEAELEGLLLAAKLYEYYESFGIDFEDELKEKFPIPYVEGAWRLVDYKKLYALQQDAYNSLHDKLKEIGPLWD